MNPDCRTLGQLAAVDLGSIVSFQDGGATYTGTLNKVDHSQAFSGPKTLVVLVSEDWRHIKSYPSETPVTVTRDADDALPARPADGAA